MAKQSAEKAMNETMGQTKEYTAKRKREGPSLQRGRRKSGKIQVASANLEASRSIVAFPIREGNSVEGELVGVKRLPQSPAPRTRNTGEKGKTAKSGGESRQRGGEEGFTRRGVRERRRRQKKIRGAEAGLLKLVQRTGGLRLSLLGHTHTHTGDTVAAGVSVCVKLLFCSLCAGRSGFVAFVGARGFRREGS